MRLAVLQSSYLPWCGYFDQIIRSDVFIILDDVQYDKHSWRNRNRIKGPNGALWLTVPVLTKGRFGQPINDVLVDATKDWRDKHLKSIEVHYKKAPFFDMYYRRLEDFYAREFSRLIDVNDVLIKLFMKEFGISTKVYYSSDLRVEGASNERLLNLCKYFGADEYLTGDSAINYLDEEMFKQSGIKVIYQNYEHPVYRQLYGDFVPYLSALDLLLNCGPESREIIRGGNSIT